jgi:cysteine desulfurase family protein (TIGR01976 family)
MATLERPAIDTIRSRFPALASGFGYMDNAGGSQVPGAVADAVRDYMLTSYAQLGADYPASQRATKTVADAHAFVNTLMNGEGVGKVVFGSSSSTLCRMLANCFAEVLTEGGEVVVATSGHEANVHPWVKLGKYGATVKHWEPNPGTGVCELSTLQGMLSARTRVVAFPHVSNILGGVEEIGPCIEAAHRVGARVVVDGVAYAPHLPIDVAAWQADFYVFSCYKVFGPHMAALFGSHAALADLTGPNHPFIAREAIPDKFELGGVLHEGCAGLLALQPYLNFMAGRPESAPFERSTVVDAFRTMFSLEDKLSAQLLEFLRSKPSVRIVGPSHSGPRRVPTISFVHDSVPSKVIADTALKANIGMRWGHFYSVRLLERMGINPDAGVARVSFAHYNTAEEVARLIGALDEVL